MDIVVFYVRWVERVGKGGAMHTKNNDNLQERIARIQRMEQYLDELLEARAITANAINKNPVLQEKLQELTDYYEGGLWLQDYDCDAKGELPVDLKRGVLAQDAVYNLLCDMGNREDEG